MHINCRAFHIELYIEQAFCTERNLRAPRMIEAAAFPQATIGSQKFAVFFGDRAKVGTADLLFTLDNPAQRDRQCAIDSAQGADGRQARSNLAFVI